MFNPLPHLKTFSKQCWWKELEKNWGFFAVTLWNATLCFYWKWSKNI